MTPRPAPAEVADAIIRTAVRELDLRAEDASALAAELLDGPGELASPIGGEPVLIGSTVLDSLAVLELLASIDDACGSDLFDQDPSELTTLTAVAERIITSGDPDRVAAWMQKDQTR
jgi:hypothetical protein